MVEKKADSIEGRGTAVVVPWRLCLKIMRAFLTSFREVILSISLIDYSVVKIKRRGVMERE